MNYIGEIIRKERCSQKISQSMLANGLCSIPMLSRIESGECFMQAELVKELLSRMGKSADKLEIIIEQEEYDLEERKIVVLQLAEMQDVQQMNIEMEILQSQIAETDYVNQRFMKEMHILKLLLSGKTIDELETELRSALAETTGEMNPEEIGKRYLSIEELKLWYLIALSRKKKQDRTTSLNILNWIKKDMEETRWDEEEKVKLYPYVINSLSEWYTIEKKWDYVLEYCDAALKLLRDNKRTSCILQLMNYKLEAMKQIGKDKTEEYQIYQKYAESWEIAEKEAGLLTEENILSVFQRKGGAEYLLLGEMVKKKRKQFDFTQAKISEALNCSEEYISRLENGKKGISKKRYENLANLLQMQKEKAQAVILTNQYEVLEKRRKIIILTQDGYFEEAYHKLNQLKELLDMSIAENKQDILCVETIILRGQKKLSDEEALKKFIEALQLTIPQFPDIPLKECIFRHCEVTLLNNIAVCYAACDRIKKALEILEYTLFAYKNSKIDVSYHCKSVVPLIFNYSKYLGLSGEYEKAIACCQKAICLNAQKRRGANVSIFLYTIGWNLKESRWNTFMYKKYCKMAYYISGLMKEKSRQIEISQIYKKNCGDDLDVLQNNYIF